MRHPLAADLGSTPCRAARDAGRRLAPRGDGPPTRHEISRPPWPDSPNSPAEIFTPTRARPEGLDLVRSRRCLEPCARDRQSCAVAHGAVPRGGVRVGVLPLWVLLPGADLLWGSLPRDRATAPTAARDRQASAQPGRPARSPGPPTGLPRTVSPPVRDGFTFPLGPLDLRPSHSPSGPRPSGPCASCVGACGVTTRGHPARQGEAGR